MKHHDRLLLHSIDAATGERLPGKGARVIVWGWFVASTHAIAFAVGYIMGSA